MSDHPICLVTHKRTYTNRRMARLALRRAGNRVRVYRCDHCHGYHVTDADKGPERNKLV